MKQTTFAIYQGTDGVLRLENYTATYKNANWEQYLADTGQEERLQQLKAMSSRKRSPRIYRIRNSEQFRQWQSGKDITVTSRLYGIASAIYDGRIHESSVKYAILHAIENGKTEALYEPKSNANKPAHLHEVYVIPYQLKKNK